MGDVAWNAGTNNWEIDGKSVTYKVTWRSVDEGGATHERAFTNIDHGYDFYQNMLKSPGAYAVIWEHMPPE